MTNIVTKRRLIVEDGGVSGPYFHLPFIQLDSVLQVLRDHSILFRVDEDVISINGGPEIATVRLGREGNLQAVQSLLDSKA